MYQSDLLWGEDGASPCIGLSERIHTGVGGIRNWSGTQMCSGCKHNQWEPRDKWSPPWIGWACVLARITNRVYLYLLLYFCWYFILCISSMCTYSSREYLSVRPCKKHRQGVLLFVYVLLVQLVCVFPTFILLSTAMCTYSSSVRPCKKHKQGVIVFVSVFLLVFVWAFPPISSAICTYSSRVYLSVRPCKKHKQDVGKKHQQQQQGGF